MLLFAFFVQMSLSFVSKENEVLNMSCLNALVSLSPIMHWSYYNSHGYFPNVFYQSA